MGVTRAQGCGSMYHKLAQVSWASVMLSCTNFVLEHDDDHDDDNDD